MRQGRAMIFDELTEVADPEPHDAALNMAIDEVLLRHATAPLVRVYRWAHPAVSFGCFGKFAVEAAERLNSAAGGGRRPAPADWSEWLAPLTNAAILRHREWT